MLRQQSFKSLCNTVSKEFEKDYYLELKSTDPSKKNIQEISKIVSRLLHLCPDEKESSRQEYHLYQLIKHSFKALKQPETREQRIRTFRLLTEECPVTLQKMLIISEREFQKDDEPILDLRQSRLKKLRIELTEQLLAKNISELFSTDNICTVFSKGSAIPIADTELREITEKNVNFTAILEYVSLCHILESNRLLLELNPEFLCTDKSFTDQLIFLKKVTNNLLSHSDGIKILNGFGYAILSQEQGQKLLQEFSAELTSIPNGMEILSAYSRVLKSITPKFLQSNALLLSEAIKDSDKMKKLLLQNPELFDAMKQHQDFNLIKQHFSAPTLLRELKSYREKSFPEKEFYSQIISIQIENQAINENEWLDILSNIQDQRILYQLMLKQYIAKKQQDHQTLERWIVSVEPKLQIQLFELLESMEDISLNYFALYAMSETLRECPSIKADIAQHKSYALAQLRTRYVFQERDQRLLDQDKSYFKKTAPELLSIDEKKFSEVKVSLEAYKNKYFVTEKSGFVTPRLLTPYVRAQAYNFLAPELNKKNPELDELQTKLLDRDFKSQINGLGFYNLRPMTLFNPLIEWAEIREKSSLEYKKYWTDRYEICQKVKNNDVLLLELLLDIDVLNSLTTREFALLFEYGNKALFAETIVRAYPGRNFQAFEWHGKKIDFEVLKQFVPENDSIAELNRINKIRYECKISQCIPPGSKYPGINSADAALSKQQLYQLQDSDIAVGETILCDEFKNHIKPIHFYSMRENDAKGIPIYKKITGTKEKPEIQYIAVKFDKQEIKLEEKTETLDLPLKVEVPLQKSNLKMVYLVPMNPAEAVLIDPKKEKHRHFRTFQEFKNKLHLTITSIPNTHTEIIAGICNLNGIHYVPYFIYCDTKGKVSVLTIDPSYETSSLLEDCFRDIFPMCDYRDAHIVQQVRQRDCGFNSLESIRSVVATLEAKNPVISIINDKLHFNPSGLTVNGEPFKGYDYQQNKTFFLKEFLQQGEKNRERWAELFRKKTIVNYNPESFVDYSYDANVESQQAEDHLDGILSVITGSMVSSNLLDQYRAQYREMLALPNAQQLEKIRQHLIATSDLSNEILESESCTESIFTICKINYKGDTAIGLFNIFRNVFLPGCVLVKDSTPESIFIEFTQTEKYLEFYKLLTAKELTELQEKALILAKRHINKDIFKLKEEFIHQYILEEIETLLKSVSTEPDLVIDEIIQLLRNHKKTREEINLLISDYESRQSLINFIIKNVQQCIKKNVNFYLKNLEEKPELWQNDKVISQNGNINVFELERAIKTIADDKKPLSLSDSQPKIDTIKNSTFYKLIQQELSIQFRNSHLKRITNELENLVTQVFKHPKNIEYISEMKSQAQILFAKRNDYLNIFESLSLQAELILPLDLKQESFHTKTLHNLLKAQFPAYIQQFSLKRFQERWDKLMHSISFKEISDEKGFKPLQELAVSKSFPLNPDETLDDFIFLHQDDYQNRCAGSVRNFKFIQKQIDDFKTIIELCMTHHLLSPSTISYYKIDLLSLQKRIEELKAFPIAELNATSQELTKIINSKFDKLIKLLYEDNRYQPGVVAPGSYTICVQHILTSLFNIYQPKKLLSSEESVELDSEFQRHLPQLNRTFSLFNTSHLILDKCDGKRLPNTYGQPLTQRILIECIQYWRTHPIQADSWNTDRAYNNILKALIGEVNRIPGRDLDEEIPLHSIEAIKKLLRVNIGYHTQFKTWMSEPKSTIESVTGAILNTRSISALNYDEKKLCPEPISITHLDQVLQIYRGKITVKNLSPSTQSVLQELKLDSSNCSRHFFQTTPYEINLLKKVIDMIKIRHESKNKDFYLDFTDIQILKHLIIQYANLYRKTHDFQKSTTNTTTDNIYIILTALLQSHTPEERPVLQLLIPDLGVKSPPRYFPRDHLVRQDCQLITKPTSSFYENFLAEAELSYTGKDMRNIKAFVEMMSKFDQVNAHLSASSYGKSMNTKFKKCVSQAKSAGQMSALFKKIACKDKPMAELIDELAQWSEMLPRQTLQRKGGIMFIS